MKILTVCGLGQGTSLILKMNIQQIADELGIEVEVDNTDVSSARMEHPDLILAGDFHKDALEDLDAPVITVEDFMDTDEIKGKLTEFLKGKE